MIGGNKDSCAIGGTNYTWGNGGDIESGGLTSLSLSLFPVPQTRHLLVYSCFFLG
jgi:hypothetical protein